MTRIDIQTKLQNHFQNSLYYSVDDINASLQDGLDEVCAFTGCIYNVGTLVLEPNKTYYDMLTALPDYIGVVAMFNPTVKRWMIPTSLRSLENERVDWESTVGTPEYFAPINFRYLAIHKKPAITYRPLFIYYIASAPEIVDTDNIPIPDDHISTLEQYSITDLWEQQQEISKAAENFKMYLSNLEELRILMKNRRNSDRIPALRG